MRSNEEIAGLLRAHAFAIRMTGFQSSHERVLEALLTEAAAALDPDWFTRERQTITRADYRSRE